MDAKNFFQDKNILEVLLFDKGAVAKKIKDNIQNYVVEPKYEKDKNINIDELESKLDELEAKKDKVDVETFERLDRELETYLAEIEQLTQKTYDNFTENFPSEVLFEYLVDNDKGSSVDDDDTSIQDAKFLFTHNSSIKEVELTSYFLTDDEGEQQSGQNTLIKIENYLTGKYKGIKKYIDNLNKLIEDIRDYIKEYARKDSLTEKNLNTSPKRKNLRGRSKQAKLDEIFRAFNSGTTVWGSAKDFIEHENAPTSDLQFRQRVDKDTLEDWKALLTGSFYGRQKVKVQPFLDLINDRILGKKDKSGKRLNRLDANTIDFKADKLVGSLDLKKVERRDSIYGHWAKYSNKYTDLTKSIKRFQQELRDNVETKNYEEIKNNDIDRWRHLQNIVDFDFDDDTFNYIVKIKPQTIKRYNKDNLYVKGFEELKLFKNPISDDINIPEAERKKRGYDGYSETTRSEEETDEKGINTGRGSIAGSIDASSDEAGYDIPIRVAEGDKTGADPDETERLNVEDKESQVSARYTKDKDFAGFGMDIAEVKGTKEIKEIDMFGRKVNTLFTQINVDPLYAYAFDKDSTVFKNIPLFKKEIERLRRKLKTISSASKSLDLGLNFDDDINDYVDELKSMVISDRKTFFLPFTKELSSLMTQQEYNKYEKNREKITKFLELISEILDFGDKKTHGGGWASEESSGSQDSPTGQEYIEPYANTKTLLKEIEEARDAFDDMIENIVEYYIKPLSTQYKPFASKIDILDTNIIERLIRSKEEDEPYFHLLALRMRGLGEVFPTRNFKVIERIIELINFTTKPSILDSATKLEKLLRELSKELIIIYKTPFAKEIEAELGAYYYSVLKPSLKPTKAKELEIFGKNAKTLFDQVVDQKSAYPLHALIDLLKQSSGRKGELMYLANDLGLSDKRAKARRKQGVPTYTKSQLKEIVRNFTEAMDDFSRTITKSIDAQILEAHDNIRKILDKPVYYKRGNLSNFDHISTTQDILKSTFNVDVSALDITKIVKESNSMQDLGLKYGISSEGVYFIKANFR